MVSLLTEKENAAQADDTHRAIWRYLSDHQAAYVQGSNVAALKRGTRSQPDQVLAGAACTTIDLDGEPAPRLLAVAVSIAGSLGQVTDLDNDDGPERLAAALFTKRRRGTVYCFPEGGRRELHLIFRRCYRDWVARGYTLSPTASGTYLKAITVRRDKQVWQLADLRSLVGLEDMSIEQVISTLAGPHFAAAEPAVATGIAAGVYASLVKEHFGVAARLTAGATAIAAMARHIPDDCWLWKPSSLAVTLARVGGGFRGGYCYYPAYRGPGYKIDIRRAYSWALTKELPCGTSLGRCNAGTGERAGLYVCRVRGPGYSQVLLAPFAGGEHGFGRRLWNGDDCYCILPQSEFAGLRALGYVVEPGWGAVYRATFTLSAFVQQVERLAADYGPDSAQGQVGKALANRVYGKFAERANRTDVVFTASDPAGGAQPFLDAAGEEVPDAWCIERLAHRSHQHIDIAAEITALVRGRLYAAMADLDASGIGVLAVDTDGMVITAHPAGVLQLDAGTVGGWRYCGYDPEITIAGPRFASIAGRIISAGTSAQSAAVVSLAFDRGTVSVEGKVMAPPWSEGPMHTTVTRRLRRGA